MARIPTYDAPLAQVVTTPTYIPNTSTAWNTVLGVANQLVTLGGNVEDKQAQREGEQEGLRRQYEAGTGSLTKSEEGLFGPTVRGTAADKSAELAYAALKKQEAEKALYDIEQKYGHDPKQFGDQISSLRQNFLTNVPLDKMPTFQTYFDGQALEKQRLVDTAAKKQQQAENLAAINGRLDGLVTRIGNNMTRDWYANAESIMSDAAEIETVLGEATKPSANAGPLIGPDKAQEYREKLTDAFGKNYAFFLYDRGSPEERKQILSSLRGGSFSLPELGREGNKLVEKGREIPIESARKIASEIETAYAKKSSEGKLEMAMIKLALGEQTAATNANQQAHPDLSKTLETAKGLLGQHPELLDDIRKGNVAVSVANDVRPYLYRTGAEIASEVNRVQEGIVSNRSKDVFRDTEYVKALREMQTQKEQAQRDGTEVEFLHRRGLVPETPYYDLSNPNSLEAGRAARLRAEAITGRPQPMLDDRFINSSKDIIENGTAKERADLLGFIGRIPRNGEERQRMFNQLGKSNPELGQLAFYFGAMQPDGQPDQVKRKIASDALNGLDYYKQNSMDTAKEQEARHRINVELGKLVTDPNQMGGLSRMAFGLMVDNARVAGQLGKSDAREFNAKDARQAVGRIIGASEADMKAGRIPVVNEAATVPFERGMSESDMRLLWRSLTDDNLKLMNGGKLPVDSTGMEVTARQIMDRGQLRYVRPGQYEVIYQDPAVQSGYPARDPSTALLSGRVNLGRPAPFLFTYDGGTRDALWAATRQERPAIQEQRKTASLTAPVQKDAWATQADVDAAYGTGNEAYISGRSKMVKPTRAELPPDTNGFLGKFGDDAQAKKSLRAPDAQDSWNMKLQNDWIKKSALVALGFDPRRQVVMPKDVQYGDLGGFYGPKSDVMAVDSSDPLVAVHESTHRSIERLLKEEKVKLPAGVNEERLVRYIMSDVLKHKESDIPDDLIIKDSEKPNLKKAFDQLEAIAAKKIAKDRPGGPR